MKNDNSCDIILPVYNKPDLTENCLKSIEAKTRTPYRLIIIDNASDERTRKYLEDYKVSSPDCVLARNGENAGWVKAVNQGIRLSSAPYVCIMNNDTVVETDDWLGGLMALADAEKDIGLVNPDFGEKAPHAGKKAYIEIDFCRGYCILVKRSVIDAIGGLDESYGLGYYDDDDFSVRAIRAGFRCVKASGVTVRHLRDSTFAALFQDDTRRALHEKNKQLFYSKWGRRLRLVFIVTASSDRKALAALLLAVARRQHIVYLWNTASPLNLEHVNVRERAYVPFISRVLFSSELLLNRMKKEAKHYDAVFVDDQRIGAALPKDIVPVHYFDAAHVDDVLRAVDEAAFADRSGTGKAAI